MEYEGDGDTNHNWGTWNSPQRRRKGTGNVRVEDESSRSKLVIGHDTEKSHIDLRRLLLYNSRGISVHAFEFR